MPRKKEFFLCPNCGAEVPEGSAACPECGSDDETGWSEDTMYDGLGLEFFDEPEPEKPSFFMNRGVIMAIALIALVAFLVFYLF